MSGKRRADNQVTRENLHEFENEDDDVSLTGPSRASADVLAKRKILKPRSRINRAGNGNGQSTTPAFQFGGSITGSDENKPANPFGGFGASTDSSSDSNKPSFSFGQPKSTEDLNKPKTNPFQFLGKSQDTPKPTAEEDEKPKSNAVGFFNNNSNTSLTKTSSSDLVSQKDTDKPNKIKALNDNFYDKITEQRRADAAANFTPILKKYIDYYDKIENDLDYLPDADNDSQQDHTEQKALPAPTFSFGKTEKPALTFNPTSNTPASSTTSGFSFGARPVEQTEQPREEKEPTPMDESKDVTQNNDQSSDSESSEDEIKVEGPKFTLAQPPTTTDSVFKFDSTTKSSAPSSTAGPSFSFKMDPSKKFDSPFKLPTVETKDEVKPKESPAVAQVKDQNNNFTWSPDKPIKFNGDTSQKDTSAPSSGFSFGQTAKPAFSFGQTSTTEKSHDTNTQSKPAFSFGGNSTASDKPAFQFGTSSNGSEEKATDATPSKPSFSFGTSNATSGFKFGATAPTTTESNDKPSFNFGGSTGSAFSFGSNGSSAPSSTFNFSFSKSTDNKAESSTATTNAGNDDDKVAEEEVEGNFKPVVQLTEKVEDKTGEEDEENLYTKRSKLMLFNPANKEQPYETKGVGELKVLQNKETQKSRLLVRSDGANRVLLNAAITKGFKYETIGKGDTVRIPVVSNEGKIETYIARVKTPEDGGNLLKALQDAQQ